MDQSPGGEHAARVDDDARRDELGRAYRTGALKGSLAVIAVVLVFIALTYVLR